MLKKAFLYRVALYELKKLFFSAKQEFSIYRKLYALLSKASRFRNQNTACLNQFLLSSKTAFLCTKSLLFAQTFPYCHPKQPFFALRRSFPPSHNLLSTKERLCSFYLRSNSLRCNAGTSHRFKAFSPPFCAKNRVRLVLPESSAKIFSGRALNRGRRTESRVLFGYFLHNAKSDKPYSCAGSFEVLRTSIQLAAMAASLKQN